MGEDKEKLLNKKKTNYFPVIILVFTIMLIIGIFAITRNKTITIIILKIIYF